MAAHNKTTGVIAALFMVLLAVPRLPRAQNPIKPDAPFFFMRPAEIPLGVAGHPFHATVTANWRLPEPGEKTFDTEVKGNVWRDTAGDVRVEGSKTRNGSTAVQFPDQNELFVVEKMTEFSWNRGTTTVLSSRSTHLGYSDHFFEGLTVPKILLFSRNFLYNCRLSGAECITESLGVRVIEGIQVKGTRYKEIIPATSLGALTDVIVSRDVWICPQIDAVVEIDGTDPLFGNFEMRLSDISEGNQDNRLFEIPKGHKVIDMTPPRGLPEPPLFRPQQ